jgi:acetyl-CoA carboxylase beta subunit
MAVDEAGQKKRVPHGLWTKCPKCEQIIYNKELEKNLKVCPKCHYNLAFYRPGTHRSVV